MCMQYVLYFFIKSIKKIIIISKFCGETVLYFYPAVPNLTASHLCLSGHHHRFAESCKIA